MPKTSQASRIAELNDAFRKTFIGGIVQITRGVRAMAEEDQLAILEAVRRFDSFTPDNDPWGEHDFGSFVHNGEKIIFKIDYYDETLTYGSEDPSDPAKTRRVLTVMLADEY